MATTKSLILKWLEDEGFEEVEGTPRYRKFRTNDDGIFWFVGKAGALRKGRSVAASRSLTHLVRNNRHLLGRKK